MVSNGIGDLNKFDFISGGMYPGSQIDHSAYANPTQIPLAAQAVRADYDPETNPLTGEPTSRFAGGGDVKDTSDLNFSYSATPQGTQEYDPRFMPFQLDNKPLTAPQMALLRLQAEKELGEGKLRAAIMGNLVAVPGERGVRGTPGNYEVGYNTPAGIGNLDISAIRAMRGTPDGKVPYGVNASYTIPFADGGIASIPRFDGEYGSQVEDPTPAEPAPAPTMSELADQLKTAYRTDTNYDDLWKQFAATKDQDPTQWYKHQLDFLGQQQGWQIGQNRSDRLAGLQPQIDNTIQQAKDAGVSDKEIKSILGRSSQEGNAANQQRIATLADMGGTGFNFQKDLQPGLTYLALATAAAMTAQPELLGAETGVAGGTTAGTGITGGTGIGVTGGTTGGVGFTGGALGTGVPAGLTVAEGSALAGTGAGGITALGGDAGGTLIGAGGGDAVVGGGAAYPGMSAELSAELGLTGSSSGLSTAGASGDVLANLGIESAGGAFEGMTAEKALMTKMLLDSATGGAGGQGGAGGSSTTTSSTPFTTNQNNPNSLQYNPNTTNTIGGMSPNSPYYGYAPLTFNYESGIKPMALKAPNLGYSAKTYAQGGIADLGGYAAGGKLLKGPGDGMSDSIVANIGGKQPARLADGEFVIPADVVSHLGNGSTDAGAKQLYKMLDRIRHARTGNKKQGKQINPNKFLPKG